MTDAHWHLWSDDDLRLLLDRARATNKGAQAEAIASELATRETGRVGDKPLEQFNARERGFLEQLAVLMESWDAALEADDRLFLRVGARPWMTFQHLDAGAIRAALALGGPPGRKDGRQELPPGFLAPELGGR
ncbi:MAG: hypothetical protein JWM80_94 [Cyanobacteria bacterium RYN_339]|nr:hypothetical protein [Cyanobacteria bacterium RYN_339]